MQVIGNQQGQPFDFLTSLLRRGGGLFDNKHDAAVEILWPSLGFRR
jgi:hypothetical protein